MPPKQSPTAAILAAAVMISYISFDWVPWLNIPDMASSCCGLMSFARSLSRSATGSSVLHNLVERCVVRLSGNFAHGRGAAGTAEARSWWLFLLHNHGGSRGCCQLNQLHIGGSYLCAGLATWGVILPDGVAGPAETLDPP